MRKKKQEKTNIHIFKRQREGRWEDGTPAPHRDLNTNFIFPAAARTEFFFRRR